MKGFEGSKTDMRDKRLKLTQRHKQADKKETRKTEPHTQHKCMQTHTGTHTGTLRFIAIFAAQVDKDAYFNSVHAASYILCLARLQVC